MISGIYPRWQTAHMLCRCPNISKSSVIYKGLVCFCQMDPTLFLLPVLFHASSRSIIFLSTDMGTTYEGGIRTPAVVMWKGHISEGITVNELTNNMDVFTTMIEIAGGAIPDDRIIDGKNILPLLKQEVSISPHEYMFHYCGSALQAVRIDLAREPSRGRHCSSLPYGRRVKTRVIKRTCGFVRASMKAKAMLNIMTRPCSTISPMILTRRTPSIHWKPKIVEANITAAKKRHEAG